MSPSHGTREDRSGAGQPAGVIEMPTLQIPVGCLCSWSVVRPGPGMACISRLTYASSLCSHLRRNHAPAKAARISA
jgi:hypothetical protein